MTDATTHGDDATALEQDAGSPVADGTAYDVPPDETPAECAYCDRPFESEALLALHRGQSHAGAVTDQERADYEAAYEAESGQLRRFRLKALVALVVIYFGFLMIYALV